MWRGQTTIDPKKNGSLLVFFLAAFVPHGISKNIHDKDFRRGSKAIVGCFLFCIPVFWKRNIFRHPSLSLFLFLL